MSILLRVLNPIVWRWHRHAARKLHAFARAEQGSLIDLSQAASQTQCPARAALYLRHASDEARHARLFSRRSAELRAAAGRLPLAPPRADTDNLFERLGEVDFLAFVHRGEARGCRQFEAYRDYFATVGRAADRALFHGVVADEYRHRDYTRSLLVDLAGGEDQARRALRRVRRWEAWRSWRRAGRGLAGRVYGLAMFAIYVAAAPLALLVRVTRPTHPGWRQQRGKN